MAEEVKKEEKSCCGGKGMSMCLKLVLGVVFLAVAVYLLAFRHWWGGYTLPVIKGCAAPFLILAGLITLAIAKE